ncbi:MAG: hypothetical protein AAB263_21835 [Planctomycetota bacterium]
MRSLFLSCVAAAAIAGEAVPVAPSATAAATTPDPSAAIVAEGVFTYRQRDLDALLLVAVRHAKAREFTADGKSGTLSRPEEDRIRQVLIRAMVAREALADVLAALPERVSSAARNAIALDLLAYKAEPAAQLVAQPTTGTVSPIAPSPIPISGPVIVRLPPFTISRMIVGSGRRQLTIGLAVAFADGAQAKAIEAQAPLMQDAVLGAMRGVEPSMFVDPDQAALKRRLSDAIRAKIPAFPADGLLVPQLEAGVADAAPER